MFKPEVIAFDVVDPGGLVPYVELRHQQKGGKGSTFSSFRNMWQRLHQLSSVGRYEGVTVDPSWVSFAKFLHDMGTRPEGKTLDRINSNGPYARWNCQWADLNTQSANRRNVHKVSDGQETLPLQAMCRKHSLDYKTTYYRIKHGWTVDEALSTPNGGGRSNAFTTVRVSPGRFTLVQAGSGGI